MAYMFADGWTKNDLVYKWLPEQYGRPVQIPGNLSLPGGFKLGGFGNDYCDVITATGDTVIFTFDVVNTLELETKVHPKVLTEKAPTRAFS